MIQYEYDGLNRLTLVRDQENNILQKYCYTFHGQQEDCSGFYKNDQKTVYFIRNNCTTGYIPGDPVPIRVKEGDFTSGLSKLDANQKADAFIIAYGQNDANTLGDCLPISPFTKISIENQYGNTADVIIRFFKDEYCTIPYYVNDISIELQVEKYNDVTGLSTYDTFIIECTGEEVTAFSSVLLVRQLNDQYYSNEYSFFSLLPGVGYTIVY